MAAINRLQAISIAIAMKKFAVPADDADIETIIRIVFHRADEEDVAHILRVAAAVAADEREHGA